MTGGGPVPAVSVNGADNVGKTTQLRWLATAIPDAVSVGTVDRWHPRWAQLAAGDFAAWWFQTSTTAEHVALVFDSHAARRRAGDGLLLEDRGWPMLIALCAATAAVKDTMTPAAALARVQEMVSGLPAHLRGGVHLLLRHADDPARDAALALAREPRAPSRWYAAYQRALTAVLDIQCRRGDYTAVMVRGDRPVLDIQTEIRQTLAGLGLPVVPLPRPPLRRVWVLAGLSESGKSTVGALLRDEHGVTRLKIGYLLEVAAARAGLGDPYTAWAETQQAERLVEELLRFTAASKATVVSLESAHRYESTMHLRRVLGAACQIVYVDADLAARSERTAEPAAALRERDEVKRGRGAHRLAVDADWLLDNTGSLATLKLAVARLVAVADTTPRPVAVQPADTPVGAWLAAAVARLVDDEVAAVAVTGSVNAAEWIPGWSDVDLLVVRDSLPVGWLRAAHQGLGAPAGVKVALTCCTTADLAAGRVVPRLVHALRRLHHGTPGLLYRRSGYLLPRPTLGCDDRSSRGELALVVMTLRRLVAAADPDLRAVHKHVLLIMKILLRAGEIDVDSPAEVGDAFAGMFPRNHVELPRPGQLLASSPAVREAASAGTLAAASNLLDLLADLDTTPRRPAEHR
jgi:hypothetical protein